VVGNEVSLNTVEVNDQVPFKNLGANDKLIFLHVRDERPEKDTTVHAQPIRYYDNRITLTNPHAVEKDLTPGVELATRPAKGNELYNGLHEVVGSTHPVGARDALAGRDKIVMTEWGPWDHQSPLARRSSPTATQHLYELYNYGTEPTIETIG